MKPQVVLVGDSIRMGYQQGVTEALAGVADVWGPTANGGDSSNVLAHLDEWVVQRRPDVVHLNAGLHDMKRPGGSAERQVPFDQYRRNVSAIFRRIRAETQAKIIWATATPVNEVWHNAVKGFDRFEADVLNCNRIAVEIAGEMGVAVNDLFRVATDAGRDRVLSEDGVHLTPAGYELLGRAVAAFIRAVISKAEK